MVDFTTQYDAYDFDAETDERLATATSSLRKRASRDLTGQQRYSRQARFSRKRSNQSSFNGAPRRRDKRNYL